jgi:hypothetical protein
VTSEKSQEAEGWRAKQRKTVMKEEGRLEMASFLLMITET